MKQTFNNIVCIVFLIMAFNIQANEINSKQTRGPGSCSNINFTTTTIGDDLTIGNGTVACTLDVYSSVDNCTNNTDTTGLSFLGTFSLDGSGSVNTGITTQSSCYIAFQNLSSSNPLGAIYLPENLTSLGSAQATIGGDVTFDLDFTGIDATIIYDGTTFSGLPSGSFTVPNISGSALSLTTRANGVDGFGMPVFSQLEHPLDFIAPSCVSATQDPDSSVTPVDLGTVVTLELISSGAISAEIDGVPMTPLVNPSFNNTVEWQATTTVVQDDVLTATITNPNGEQTTCQWTIQLNCEDPMIDSVAAVGEMGIVISGSPGCSHTVSVTDSNQTVTEYQVDIGFNGLGELDIVVPPNSLIEVGSDSFMTGPVVCSDINFTTTAIGEMLTIGNGTNACMLDLYSSTDNCTANFDFPALTFLGTFTLDGTGGVNTGINTASSCYIAFQNNSSNNPLGAIFLPENLTSLGSAQATIGGDVTFDLDFTGIDATVTYNGTTFDGLPGGSFTLPNISASALSLSTRANGVDGFGMPVFSQLDHPLDFIAPSCVSVTQDPDSSVTPVDIGTVLTLNLTSAGAVSAVINGVPMTPNVDPLNNNSVEWSATYTAIEDDMVSATITNPNGEQTTCQWTIQVNCEDPTINSVAAVGEVGIVISGSSGCSHTVTVTEANQNITEYEVIIGANGLGELNIVVPPNSLIEVGNDSFMTGDANMAPEASLVSISGNATIGSTLTGQYTYNDIDNDLEGDSTYQWYRNGNPILGATSLNYDLTSSDSGTTITFEVTPVAQTGELSGVPVSSAGVLIEITVIPVLSTWFLSALLLLIFFVGLRQMKRS